MSTRTRKAPRRFSLSPEMKLTGERHRAKDQREATQISMSKNVSESFSVVPRRYRNDDTRRSNAVHREWLWKHAPEMRDRLRRYRQSDTGRSDTEHGGGSGNAPETNALKEAQGRSEIAEAFRSYRRSSRQKKTRLRASLSLLDATRKARERRATKAQKLTLVRGRGADFKTAVRIQWSVLRIAFDRSKSGQRPAIKPLSPGASDS